MAKEISSELLNTILTRVGGPGNIASCGNCMTRLRLGVHDSSLVDPDIKTLEGVKGVILTSDQVQVVFGLLSTGLGGPISVLFPGKVFITGGFEVMTGGSPITFSIPTTASL